MRYHQFKIGDYVRRVADDHMDMVIGDIAIVTEVDERTLRLDKYGGTHSARKFILAVKPTILPEDLFIL